MGEDLGINSTKAAISLNRRQPPTMSLQSLKLHLHLLKTVHFTQKPADMTKLDLPRDSTPYVCPAKSYYAVSATEEAAIVFASADHNTVLSREETRAADATRGKLGSDKHPRRDVLTVRDNINNLSQSQGRSPILAIKPNQLLYYVICINQNERNKRNT